MDVEILELTTIVNVGLIDNVGNSLKSLDKGILDIGYPIWLEPLNSYIQNSQT